MAALQLIARYTISPGQQAAVLELLPQLALSARAEPGNLGFEVYRHLDDDRRVVLLERYASREALTAHRESPHFRDLVLGRIVPLLESRVVEEYEVES